jgi:hypothetical protein
MPFLAFRAALLLLLLVAVAWFIRTGLWSTKRLLPLGLALLVGLALLSRRIGLGEILVITAVIVIPGVLFAPSRR